MAATVQTDTILNRKYAAIDPIWIASQERYAERLYIQVHVDILTNAASIAWSLMGMDDIFADTLETGNVPLVDSDYADYVAADKADQFLFDYVGAQSPGGHTITFVP